MSEFVRTISIRQRRMPHWTTDEGTYFVTFRLIDAMSPELARRIALRKRPHRLADRILDRCMGRCWLRDSRVAGIVDRALRFFDEARYVLHAWTIMPNHVHVAFRLLPGISLANVTRNLEGIFEPGDQQSA